MKCPAEVYKPSTRPYQGIPEPHYPFHDKTVMVTSCGRLCLHRKKINLSTCLAGQAVGIKEVDNGPDEPPLRIEKIPGGDRLQLVLNTGSDLLTAAKAMRPKEEEAAVAFVFKYGLALTAMGLLDAMKKTEQWKQDEAACRGQIEDSARGIALVIVPLCLSLPKKLPKPK